MGRASVGEDLGSPITTWGRASLAVTWLLAGYDCAPPHLLPGHKSATPHGSAQLGDPEDPQGSLTIDSGVLRPQVAWGLY